MNELKEAIENSSIKFDEFYLCGNLLTVSKILPNETVIFRIKVENGLFFVTKCWCTQTLINSIETTDIFVSVQKVLNFLDK